jgi:hypothetical protein
MGTRSEPPAVSALSRRDFLKAFGISAGAAAAPWGALQALAAGSSLAAGTPALWGRALWDAPVTDGFGQAVRLVLPDEVTPLRPWSATHVQLADGRVAREALQPIARPARWAVPNAPGWVQVAAPYAALRRWCAPDAPLAARPGWGAVLNAVAILPVDGRDWLGLRLGDTLVWSLAAAWRAVPVVEPEAGDALVLVERRARRVQAVQNGVALWSAEAAIPDSLAAGDYPLVGRAPSDSTVQPGAPWALDFGAWRATGAYWHNSFAAASYAPPAGLVELPVLAAEALWQLPAGLARVI